MFTEVLPGNGLHTRYFYRYGERTTQKPQPPVLLSKLATDCLSRVCLRGNFLPLVA
jgi:hypothetical protein